MRKVWLAVIVVAAAVFGTQFLRGLITDHEARISRLEYGGGDPVPAI